MKEGRQEGRQEGRKGYIHLSDRFFVVQRNTRTKRGHQYFLGSQLAVHCRKHDVDVERRGGVIVKITLPAVVHFQRVVELVYKVELHRHLGGPRVENRLEAEGRLEPFLKPGEVGNVPDVELEEPCDVFVLHFDNHIRAVGLQLGAVHLCNGCARQALFVEIGEYLFKRPPDFGLDGGADDGHSCRGHLILAGFQFFRDLFGKDVLAGRQHLGRFYPHSL